MFLSEDGRWCGIRVQEQLDYRYEVHPRFETSVLPELWVTSAWPAIPIGQHGAGGTQAARRQEPDKFLVQARVVAPEDQPLTKKPGVGGQFLYPVTDSAGNRENNTSAAKSWKLLKLRARASNQNAPGTQVLARRLITSTRKVLKMVRRGGLEPPRDCSR